MISPPTTAPAVESRPPSTAAGIAVEREQAASSFDTPGAGKLVKNSAADRRQRARHGPRAGGHAVEADAHQRGGLARRPRWSASRCPSRCSVNAAQKTRHQRRAATSAAATRVCGTVTPSSDAVRRPRARRWAACRCRSRRVSSVASTMSTPIVTIASVSGPPWRRRSGAPATTSISAAATARRDRRRHRPRRRSRATRASARRGRRRAARTDAVREVHDVASP